MTHCFHVFFTLLTYICTTSVFVYNNQWQSWEKEKKKIYLHRGNNVYSYVWCAVYVNTCICTGYGSRCYDPSALAYQICKIFFCLSNVEFLFYFIIVVVSFDVQPQVYKWCGCTQHVLRLILMAWHTKKSSTMAIGNSNHTHTIHSKYILSMSSNYTAEWITFEKYEDLKMFFLFSKNHYTAVEWNEKRETELI